MSDSVTGVVLDAFLLGVVPLGGVSTLRVTPWRPAYFASDPLEACVHRDKPLAVLRTSRVPLCRQA